MLSKTQTEKLHVAIAAKKPAKGLTRKARDSFFRVSGGGYPDILPLRKSRLVSPACGHSGTIMNGSAGAVSSLIRMHTCSQKNSHLKSRPRPIGKSDE